MMMNIQQKPFGITDGYMDPWQEVSDSFLAGSDGPMAFYEFIELDV